MAVAIASTPGMMSGSESPRRHHQRIDEGTDDARVQPVYAHYRIWYFSPANEGGRPAIHVCSAYGPSPIIARALPHGSITAAHMLASLPTRRLTVQ